MKSIELTAWAVREYDVKYTIVLDENDPLIEEILKQHGITIDKMEEFTYLDYQNVWDTIMSSPLTDVKIEEDFAQGDERFVDFEHFITENPSNSPDSVVE